ncbi:hypothetical protein [Ferruginibacter albus]|uniref:hypothetical protein n=1 Tax=Ferruginibacter albus TaxID=2875540 RepID=UPI001CC4D60F|nr:hypothetical protein [Ferruginibacter albus]UAY52365.1 hypothetical protein K9M53_01410 [Ferruginibacter albus]
MKKIIIALSIIAIAMSCNHPDKELKATIANADSVYVQYFSGDQNNVATIRSIKNTDTLNKLTEAITATTINGKSNCGYDGSIHFFKNNVVVQDVYFKMNNEDCSQFTFIQNNRSAATKLSADAKKLLTELKK